MIKIILRMIRRIMLKILAATACYIVNDLILDTLTLRNMFLITKFIISLSDISFNKKEIINI